MVTNRERKGVSEMKQVMRWVKRISPYAVVITGLILLVVLSIAMPGARSLLRDFWGIISWILNLVLTLVLLALLCLLPIILGVLTEFGANEILEEDGRWHWAFCLLGTAIVAFIWPYLVMWTVTWADWLSRLFAQFAGQRERMVFETPPVWWGVAAGILFLFSYLVATDASRDC